jgi:exodeoxyribonuclease V alpha subunit
MIEEIPYDIKEEVSTNVKANIIKSLKDRIEEGKLTNITIDSNIPSPILKETFSLDIILNEKQQAAVNFADIGKSFVLLGAAGTGKTSSEREILHSLLKHNSMKSTNFKNGTNRVTAPSVAVVAYTRRAAANSAKAILKDPFLREQLPHNIMTIHNLLEFQPETYIDEVTNAERFRFSPIRNQFNKLDITHLIIEEATLVGLDLWAQLYDALPYDVQIIFVGDINQLPPVFGPSILNYALTKLPVVELTQVYRQAEGSPIINNAHRILKGEMLLEGDNEQGKLQIITGKNNIKVGQHKTLLAISTMFKSFYDSGLYNPEEDIILSPWNKQELGTDSLNTRITEFLSVKHSKIVYEVIAGFNKLYLAEGDKVIYNKRDCLIVSIERNPAYVGKEPQIPSADLSRLGFYRGKEHEDLIDDLDSADSIDYTNFSLEDLEETATERKMQASHKVMLAFEDGHTETLTAAGDLAPSAFQLGYAMTVHKSQGSEWRRVFIIFHPDHQMSLSREMLYTAITRAREEVYLIAKRYVVDKAVITQKVKGNTLQDKIALFNSGVKDFNLAEVRVTKPSLEKRD